MYLRATFAMAAPMPPAITGMEQQTKTIRIIFYGTDR